MKILAVDTATQSCSAAIVDGNGLLAELTTVNDQTHSKHLLTIIDTVLGMADLKVAQLDGFAVSVGPGSFTGLRIGISSIKGLAFAMNKPVVGVSSLEALAFQYIQYPYLICPVLDARKQEVYYCRYRSQNGRLIKECREQVAPPADALRGIREPCLFTGDGADLYRDVIASELGRLAQLVTGSQQVIRASAVAWLSLSRFKRRETDDVQMLVPHYIRKSDAELKIQSSG